MARKLPRGIDRAIAIAGSQSDLARKLTLAGVPITQQAVSRWQANGIVPQPHVVLAIEELTGVAREQLNSQIYPKRRAGSRRAVASV